MRRAHLGAVLGLVIGGCAMGAPLQEDAGEGDPPGGEVDADPGTGGGGSIDASVDAPIDARPGEVPPDASVDATVDAIPDATVDATPDATVDAKPGDPVLATWRIDTAAEFGASGHLAALAAIDSRGALEPFAYLTGGVLVRASDTDVIATASTTTWAQVQAFTATSRTAIARVTDQTWEGTPVGLGLTDGNRWTMWFEGEILLEAGEWTFSFGVNDRGFLEVADAAGTFARVANSEGSSGTGKVTVANAGWYPIRWTASDVTGSATSRLQYRGPGVGSLTAIPREKLRVRTDLLRGTAMTAFDDELLWAPVSTTIDGESPAHRNWAQGTPADVGITGPEDFSLRWAGQLRIDVAGVYTFRYSSDDGQRLFIDGVSRLPAAAWGETTADNTTSAIDLAAGWHDVFIDFSDHTSSAAAQLTVASGPDLVGEGVPVARLRPVEGRGERMASGANFEEIGFSEWSTGVSDVAIGAPTGLTTTSVDVMAHFDHSYPADVTVTLVAPDDTQVVLRNRERSDSADIYVRKTVTLPRAVPVNGRWRVYFEDANLGDSGTVRATAINVRTTGIGQPPITPMAIYESPVRELGDAVSIDRVTWEERRPSGADVVVKMRTCATAAACATAAWSTPMTEPAGSVPLVTAQRFAQYRVELVSNGDASSSLEWVQIDYKARP